MKTDILFLAHGRVEFTRKALECLLVNTDWSLVRKVHLYADGEETGGSAATLEAFHQFLKALVRYDWIVLVEIHRSHFCSPVGVMNHYLDVTAIDEINSQQLTPQMLFVKLDNDTCVPAGWLGVLLRVMEANPQLELLGIEPQQPIIPYLAGEAERGWLECSHIGGIGIMRASAFARTRPKPNGRFGFTEWQHGYEPVRGWLMPALPVCLLDHVPVEPWRSHSADYVAAGVQRVQWGEYTPDAELLWDWLPGVPRMVS